VQHAVLVEILITAAQLYEKSHLSRFAVGEGHSTSSELLLFDRPYITSCTKCANWGGLG